MLTLKSNLGGAEWIWIDEAVEIYTELPHYGGLWHAFGLIGLPSHEALLLYPNPNPLTS